ncbi:MAG: caspase family protein [Spirochaetales bacterium]|nr:caspase family protein [Spirochaetales bacterium]
MVTFSQSVYKIFRIAGFILILFFLSAVAAFSSDPAGVGRYALIIGKNNGGNERVMLKYAATDAAAFSQVLQEMGGLQQARQVLLLDPSVREIEEGFDAISKRIELEKESLRRSEFIVYYSGHSDENGLLISNNSLSYKKLRDYITNVPADVRIAIIDSCASGVFIRTKGGTQQPPFLVDSSTEMKGYAFLTSSSENESAQESDRLAASFFTHYLVSGLRGGADATQDSVVTLNEAYHYAFKETLAKTEKTRYGAQHPSYDIQLTGTGDLILTDLRETTSGVVFHEALNGIIYIRNHRGDLIVELNKSPGTPMEIGLTPGTYKILIETENKLLEASVQLSKGSRTRVSLTDMARAHPEGTTARGSSDELILEPGSEELLFTPFSVSLFPMGGHTNTETAISLNLTVGLQYRVRGFMFSMTGSIINENLSGGNFAGVFSIMNGNLKGGTFSGVFNMVSGDTSFFSGAGVFNIGGGKVAGVQFGGVFNIAGADVLGAQLSGVWNICGKDLRGGQAAGVVNMAGDVEGVQVAGVFNMAEDVKGAQVGLVNTGGRIDGVQVGLINISDENHGASIGLVTISKNGIHNFELWADTDSMSYAAFKSGTEYFYSIFLAGYDLFGDSGRWAYGIGLGAHIPLDPVFIDTDILITSVHTVNESPGAIPYQKTLLPKFRSKVGASFFNTIGVFAGVELQFHYTDMYYGENAAANALFEFPVQAGNTCSVVPGFVFGVQLLN